MAKSLLFRASLDALLAGQATETRRLWPVDLRPGDRVWARGGAPPATVRLLHILEVRRETLREVTLVSVAAMGWADGGPLAYARAFLASHPGRTPHEMGTEVAAIRFAVDPWRPTQQATMF